MKPEDTQPIRDAVRALPPIAPDPAFRTAAKVRFLAAARPRRQSLGRWALAAGVLLAVGAGFLWGNAGTPWEVVSVTGNGTIFVDGSVVAVTDQATPALRLRAGARIVTTGTVEVTVASRGTLCLVFTPETDATLPAVPGRLVGRRVSATLHAGELRGATGPRYAGARLTIAMRHAAAEVTGTTFAAIENDEGSCLCVFEGMAHLGGAPLAAGSRRVVSVGGGARDEELRPMERMKLEMLRDQAPGLLGLSGSQP